MRRNSKFLSISCIIVAHVCFTTQDMAIKLISGNYALHQIILIRSILAILFTLLVFVPIDGGFKYLGYVIAKCCEMFFVEMNEQSASNA